MKTIIGKEVFSDIAIGQIYFVKNIENIIDEKSIDDVDDEILRYENAKSKAKEQLREIYEKTEKKVGESEAKIFEAHLMMIDDQEYTDSICDLIRKQKYNAEYAVAVTRDRLSNMFEAMEEEYFKSCAVDVKDVSKRIIDILCGNQNDYSLGDIPVIVVAKELTPSETMQMDRDKILAFVIEDGSINSHTAILARTMGIPALIDITVDEDWQGKMAIVDSYTGKLIIEPDEENIRLYNIQKERYEDDRQSLQELKGKENITLSGQKIRLYANIGTTEDVKNVLENDADGIGLFRSEFLYLEKDRMPTEDEQFEVYRYIAETMEGRDVIIRTVDIGADKQVNYMNLDEEYNPALGYRGIRMCLNEPEIFKTQIRAILRASLYGTIKVMYPMIISVEEVREIKKIVEEVKQELVEEGVQYVDIKQGIMIETPAAAIISDTLAKEVDFFSIGTNDLTQYTLALDRQNPKLNRFYNPYHDAILKLIEIVVKNGHDAGIEVGICGELGADTRLTEFFLEIGVDELSVTPAYVLPVRNNIRRIR